MRTGFARKQAYSLESVNVVSIVRTALMLPRTPRRFAGMASACAATSDSSAQTCFGWVWKAQALGAGWWSGTLSPSEADASPIVNGCQECIL